MSPVNTVPVEVMVGMSWQTIEPLTCQASDINVCPYIYLSVYHLYIHMYNVYTYKYFHLFSIYVIISGIEFQDMMEDSASTSGNGVINELNKDEYHLKEIQKILRDGDTVLDLGSNIGLTVRNLLYEVAHLITTARCLWVVDGELQSSLRV